MWIYTHIYMSFHSWAITSIIASMKLWDVITHSWASCQIRKIVGCPCAGNAGIVFPRRRLQRKLLVSDPGMHHGTCVTHVPWCMSGSLTRGGEENVPGIPGACAAAVLRIWKEAHVLTSTCRRWFRRYVLDEYRWKYMMCLHIHTCNLVAGKHKLN